MSRSNPRRRRPSRRTHGKAPAPGPLQVLREDDALIAVCKPDGLLTQGDQTGDRSLLDAVRAHLEGRQDHPESPPPFVGLVHRLDRPVWGVVVFAKSSKAAASLSKQFREGTITKTYLAVVEGLPDELEGSLHNWLLRREQKSSRVYDKPVTDGQEVRLDYHVAAANPHRSVLEITPHTGRKHQIRAQLAHMGHPIMGDRRYGAKNMLPDGRLALMARALEFEHPDSGRLVRVQAPEPPWWPHVV